MNSALLIFLGLLAGTLLQAAVEVVVAKTYTRPKVRADVAADALALIKANVPGIMRDVLAESKPGAMRGGVDPSDAAARRWEVKAEKDAQRATTRTAIFAWLVETFGAEEARVIEAWCPKDIMESAVNAGDRWRPLLEPIVRAGAKRGATKSAARPAGFAME